MYEKKENPKKSVVEGELKITILCLASTKAENSRNFLTYKLLAKFHVSLHA